MRLDLGFVLRDSLQHLCDSVSDVILDDVSDKSIAMSIPIPG